MGIAAVASNFDRTKKINVCQNKKMRKRDKMKILAFYLPQFHEIRENNEWWGEHYTEWRNLKTAKPTYRGQYQPRIPMNHNYYNLTEVKTLEWQAKLAKKYGVYGFVYYHYWFEEGMLLEKPAELMLQNPSVDIPFCFSWANHTWKREWASKSDKVLRRQTYGNENEWHRHFYYLLPFFRDSRYIKIEGKPLFIIYAPKNFYRFPEMLSLWEKLAKKEGLKGITFVHQDSTYNHTAEDARSVYQYGIEFQMSKAVREYTSKSLSFKAERVLNRVANVLPFLRCKATTMHYSYDDIWNIILKTRPKDNSWFPGAFVDWDNTPRRKNRGQVCTGVTPEKFQKYLSFQIRNAKEHYHKDIIFLFAWNEWGESGYLEPDERYGLGMLEAVRKALAENGELPEKTKMKSEESL